jgi:hypothetical protein
VILGLGKPVLFLVIITLCFPVSKTSFAANCDKLGNWNRVQVDDDSLLISLLRVNKKPVSPEFDVYVHKSTYLIPVSALNDLLQLDWTIDRKAPGLSSAEGKGIESLCDFSIILSNSEGQDGLLWAQDDFDVYIDIAALPHLFGGTVNYKFSLLQLNILSDVDFPGLRGPSAIPNLLARNTLAPDRVIADQYRLLTPPLVNYRVAGNYSSAQSDGRLVASANAFFDVVHHAAELRVNANDTDTQQFLRFSKNLDITGDQQAINFLRYEVGDIQLQSDELIYRSKQAFGVSIFNFDPNYSRSFSQVTIEETLLPGWRAQLFRNGQFLQESFSNEQNRVVFELVDTFYGSNLFEIKLYGPEGQQEIRHKTINVGTEQLNPGVINYSFNASDAGKRFIDSDKEELAYDQNVSALVSYGLNYGATIEASLHSLRGLEQQQDFVSSAVYMNFANSALKTQFVKDLDAGNALFVGLNTRFGKDLRANFNARYFNNFESDAYPQSRDIRAEARLRLIGRASWWDGVNWSSSLQHRSYNEREDTNEVSISVSKNLLGGTLSSSFSYDDAVSDQAFRHRVFWSKNISGWQISNSLEWLPADDQEILNYYSVIRWPQQYAMFNESRIEYRANLEDKILLRHRFNWRQEQFNLQFGASLTDGGEWTVNFGISGDIEYDMYEQQLNYYRPRGSVANIHALAFLDNNRNSIFDTGDEPLSDVGMKGNFAWQQRRTNSEGKLQLATGSRNQSLQVDESSLADPFMLPVDKLVHVNTHRGGINWVELPVVTFNDLEGAIYRVNKKNSRGVSGLKIKLVDAELNIIAETRTEIDGFFFFSRIPPGKYTLQLDAEYLENNELSIANLPSFIDAPQEGDSLRLNDVLLIETSQEPLLAAESNEEATSVKFDKFFVQLGAFKKPRSIIEVLKYLPTEEYDLKIFRNHLTGLSYVVMGGYASREDARHAIDKIKSVTQFTEAYVNNGSRYFSKGWSLEYELLGIAEHLQLSHTVIQDAEVDSYFCQLASYSSLTSISADVLNDIQVVHVARRQVNNKRFYTLYTGPVSSPLDCQQSAIKQLTPDVPFALSTATLRSQVMDKP